MACPHAHPSFVACLQAGAGAWIFHGWARWLPPGVELLPIELPGHNSRLSEPPATDLRRLAADVASVVLAAAGDTPYVILGHSMGAWLAYEAVLAIQRLATAQSGGCDSSAAAGPAAPALAHGASPVRLPVALVVSANRAPHLAGAEHDTDPTRLHRLEGDAFWAAFERRYGANPALVRTCL